MDNRVAHRLFAAGAAAGLLVALATALGPWRGTEAPDDAVARVGNGYVTRAALDRAVDALSADNRNPVDAAGRARVLDRLIDEEALVQRGIELGLPETDLSVRKAVVDAVLQFAAAQGPAEPTETDLRRFYDSRPLLFAVAPLVELHATVDGAPLPLPAGPIPLDRVGTLAGPTVQTLAARLAPGQTATATGDDGRRYTVQVRSRQAAARPAFEAVRPAVEEAWRRVAQEAAVDRYLKELRRELGVSKTGR